MCGRTCILRTKSSVNFIQASIILFCWLRSYFVYSCVCVFCVYVSMCFCECRSSCDNNTQGDHLVLVLDLSCLRQGFLVVHHYVCIRLDGQQASVDFPLCLLFCPRNTEITDVHCTQLSRGSRDSSSGSHTSITSALPTQASPSSVILIEDEGTMYIIYTI